MLRDWLSIKRSLKYPVPPAPATAVLVDWFRPAGRVRVFPDGWGREVRVFQPAAMAAEWSQWELLLHEPLTYLTHAVIVLARTPEALLTENQRDRLWRAFHVPVFEQIVTENGLTLAMECEAHDGLHVESLAPFDEHEPGIDSQPCGCGRNTSRLRFPAVKPSKRAPHSAQTIAAGFGETAA